MANPQKENGYTAIANEILERLYAIPLSGSEYKIILCVLRKTYGWRKLSDNISLSQLVTETKLSRKQVCDVINKLTAKKIIFRIKKTNINEYFFNKDYEMWLVTERLMGSYDSVTKVVTDSSLELVTEMTHTKEKKEIKEILTKERKYNFLKEKEKLISKLDIGGIK